MSLLQVSTHSEEIPSDLQHALKAAEMDERRLGLLRGDTPTGATQIPIAPWDQPRAHHRARADGEGCARSHEAPGAHARHAVRPQRSDTRRDVYGALRRGRNAVSLT
jgi:hypothetical protein